MLALSMTKLKTGVFSLSFIQGNPPVALPIVPPMVVYFHAAYNGFTINKDSTTSGGITINASPNNNTGTLQIEPGDTVNLPLSAESSIVMPCELTLQNGAENYELDRGNLILDANVGIP